MTNSTSSLANSTGPWSLVAFAVARDNRRVLPAVAAATLTLACCELGYAIATEIRSGSNATSTVVFWLAAALFAGPPLGVASAWSTRRGPLRSVGFAVIGGVPIGEGAHGWTTVADTTDWRYWAVEVLIGGVSVSAVALRSRHLAHAALAIGTAGLTVIAVFATARRV